MENGEKLGAVIAVGNQKGGVGKTTNTVHLAAALGQRGFQCLIMDLDPAAGSTKHLGIPVDSFTGTLELLTTEEKVESLAISDGMPRGVHLIPSRPELSEINTLLSKYKDKTRILERPIAEARSQYDFILLDTGPSAAFTTTVAAYCSAEWFLLSAFPHPLSLGGLTEAFKDIADVRLNSNRNLEVLGVVFTCVDNRVKILRKQLEQTVADALPGRSFKTVINQANILPTVSGRGLTVFQLQKNERIPVVQQYLRLSVELEHRVRNRKAFLESELSPPELSGQESVIAISTHRIEQQVANA